ncbi:MAG: PAS domain-containing protein, partial [Solirubrobacteraceae bacterium]
MGPERHPNDSRAGSRDESAVVLVADGDDVRRAKLRQTLEQAGMTVTEAADHDEAVALARRCDVIVVDIEIPDRGGLALAGRLRADRVTAGVAILERSAGDLGPAGTVRAIQAGADAYLPESIEPELLIAAVRSLSRRGAQARETLDARFRLQAGIDAVPIGVLLLDRALTVIGANRRVRRMGLTVARPYRRPLREAIPGDAADHIERISMGVLTTGTDHAEGFSTVGLAGPRYWQVRAHPVGEATAGIEGVGVTIEDVTELEHALERLRESQRRWQAVLDSDETGVVLRDRDSRVIVCNDAYARIFEAENAEALIGTDLYAILAPEAARPATERFRERWAG